MAGILKTSDALVKDIRCSLRFSIALFGIIEFTSRTLDIGSYMVEKWNYPNNRGL